MRLNIDTPQVQDNELSPDLNRWFTNIVDQINFMFGNIVADRTGNIGGAGAGPLSVAVAGMTANSIVIATIQASSNPVTVQKVTATSTGFDILLSGDPGANLTVNYTVFIAPWTAQGV